MKILTMPSDDIIKFSESLTKEAASIRKDALELTWSMRGGIQYDSVLRLSFKERQMINDISKSNLEVAKKSGMPYF